MKYVANLLLFFLMLSTARYPIWEVSDYLTYRNKTCDWLYNPRQKYNISHSLNTLFQRMATRPASKCNGSSVNRLQMLATR